MIYWFIIILALLPLMIVAIFDFILKIDMKFSTVYIIEGILVILLSTLAHIYYNFMYNFSLFPSSRSIKTIIIIAALVMFIYFLYDLIFNRDNENKKTILIMSGTILAVILVILVWLLPLEQKYMYARMLDKIEETFGNKESGKVVRSEAVSIGLISSDKEVRPGARFQRSHTSYKSHFYIKNEKERASTVDIVLTLYDEEQNALGSKKISNLTVPAQTTEQLYFHENGMKNRSWESFSTSTRKKVDSFEVHIENK